MELFTKNRNILLLYRITDGNIPFCIINGGRFMDLHDYAAFRRQFSNSLFLAWRFYHTSFLFTIFIRQDIFKSSHLVSPPF